MAVSLFTQDRVQQHLVEQIIVQGLPSKSLTFQLRVVAKIFLLQRRLPVCRVRQIMGFFALFPVGKRCALGLALGVGTAPRVEPIHAGGSAGGFLHGCSWCVDAFSKWQVETSGLGPRSLAAGVKAGTWPMSCVSLRLFLEEFLRVSCPLCSRSSHLESGTLFLRCFWQSLFRVSGCCLCVRKLDSSGDDITSWVQCLVQQWTHVLRQYSGGFGRMYTFSTLRRTRFLKRCFSIRFEWRSVPSRCFSCSLALRGSHFVTLEVLFTSFTG